MSYTGKSPKLKRTRFIPQTATPVNPAEGDLYYSDGTARAEGMWYYKNGAWQSVLADNSVISTLTMDKLKMAPLAADPGSPVEGEVFYADGTSRETGLWVYNGTGWIQISRPRMQEFKYNQPSAVRVCTTVNITISTALNNGDVLNGVTLATNDRVLVKDQTVTSENGVYVVGASPQRATDYDTAAEVTRACVYVTAGTVNAHTVWFQNSTIVTLGADSQSWSLTASPLTFTVPYGVTEVQIYGIGSGGGGGGGGCTFTGLVSQGGGGAGGGASYLTGPVPMTVTPASTLTITLGKGGVGGPQATVSGNDGSAGNAGFASTVTGGTDGYTISFQGGNAGTAGQSTGTVAAAASSATGTNFQKLLAGGNGGAGSTAPGAGSSTQFGTGGAVGVTGGFPSANVSGGGGGGAAGYAGAGGAGGRGWGTTVSTEGSIGIGYGSGGGGGGGGGNNSLLATRGAPGGNGYVRIVW